MWVGIHPYKCMCRHHSSPSRHGNGMASVRLPGMDPSAHGSGRHGFLAEVQPELSGQIPTYILLKKHPAAPCDNLRQAVRFYAGPHLLTVLGTV